MKANANLHANAKVAASANGYLSHGDHIRQIFGIEPSNHGGVGREVERNAQSLDKPANDDEDKAEAMGIPTLRYKQVGWAIAAFFMGCTGAVFGNMVGYIEPLEVAFPVATFGIFMVAMSLLGGKGTLWGCSNLLQ